MTVSRSITFLDDFYERLKKEADEKGISVATLIKLACSQFLNEEESKRKKN